MTADVEHFQDCDDLALGRFARSAMAAGFGGAFVERNAAAAVAGGGHRQGCQCAALRASAAATYQGRVRKAAAAKGGQ